MITQEQANRRLADLVEACRRHRAKATHQRTEILRALAATEEHPDAETIYTRVRRRIPAISLDTVYRTLRMLEDKEIITRVGSMRDRARFDANGERHHHFVCTRCGMIGDFHSETLDRFPVPPEVREMGRVDGGHVELRGRCRRCQQGEEKPSTR